MEHLIVLLGAISVVASIYIAVAMERRIKHNHQFSMWIDDDAEKEWRSRRRKTQLRDLESGEMPENEPNQ